MLSPVSFEPARAVFRRELCAASQLLTHIRYVTPRLSPRLAVLPGTSREVQRLVSYFPRTRASYMKDK
jgi:hypothetical protein